MSVWDNNNIYNIKIIIKNKLYKTKASFIAQIQSGNNK